MKTCTSCHTTKPLCEFHVSNRTKGLRPPRKGFGVQAECKACKAERNHPGILEERRKAAELKGQGFKKCGDCNEVKSVSEFHIRRASIDGLAYRCKPCVNLFTEKWRESHPGAHANWYRNNKPSRSDYNAKWRSEHRDELPARIAAWAKKNPGKVNSNIAKRRAAKIQAVPPWSDLNEIKKVYTRASELRKQTGGRYEVDHIVPLQNAIVCGLHWEGNLQIILKSENVAKLNRYWPGMPAA